MLQCSLIIKLSGDLFDQLLHDHQLLVLGVFVLLHVIALFNSLGFSLLSHCLDVLAKVVKFIQERLKDVPVYPKDVTVHSGTVGVLPLAVKDYVRFSKHGSRSKKLAGF